MSNKLPAAALKELKDIAGATDEINKKLDTLNRSEDELVAKAKKRAELAGNLVKGVGDLATTAAGVVKSATEALGISSQKLDETIKKISAAAETFKGALEFIHGANERLREIKEYKEVLPSASGKSAAFGAEAAGAGTAHRSSVTPHTKPPAAAKSLPSAEPSPGIAQQIGGAAASAGMMLPDIASEVGGAAKLAGPYALAAGATALVYETVVQILGAMGAVDASSASLVTSYTGWQEAAKAAATSAQALAEDEAVRKTRAEQRAEKAQAQSAALDERYAMVEANRKYLATVGINLDRNVPLEKFDAADVAEQSKRAKLARHSADAQKSADELIIPTESPEAEAKHEAQKPHWWERAWYGLTTALEGGALSSYGYDLPEETINADPMKQWKEAGATHAKTLPGVPDYTTSIKEYERLEKLQERGLDASVREYNVLRAQSTELKGQVQQGEELLRQAQSRVRAEQDHAESTVADFSRLDPESRKKVVEIAARYQATGRLSIADARELDKDGLARDLTNRTFAANASAPERAALETLGIFKGVDAAKEAEIKASQELTRAKNEEAKAAADVKAVYQQIVEQAAAIKETSTTITDLKSKTAKAETDRGGLASPDAPKQFTGQPAGVPQAAVDFEKAFDRILQDELVPSVLDSVSRAVAKLKNAA